MKEQGKSEHIIQDIAGCGPFQILLVASISVLAQFSVTSTHYFMTFATYNPGYRCMDNLLTSNSTAVYNNNNLGDDGGDNNTSGNTTSSTSTLGYDYSFYDELYTKDNCTLYESCTNIQFSPDTSTIVTEWGLVCGKAWVPSLILSIEMCGLTIGSSLGGVLGDIYGRKTVIYSALFLQLVINVAVLFSKWWEMMTTLRFCLGIVNGCYFTVFYVFCTEFVPIRWRSPLAGIPFPQVAAMIYSVFCMLFKDWRMVQILAIVASFIALIPALFVPESLRWLEVKNKSRKFQTAARRIVKLNGKAVEMIGKDEPAMSLMEQTEETESESEKGFTLHQLVRSKYLKTVLLLGLPWFSLNLCSKSIQYGVKSLGGQFYHNLIIIQAISAALSPVPILVPNVLGRKKSSILFGGLASLCFIGAASFHELSGDLKTTGFLVLALLVKSIVDFLWAVFLTYTVEIFPTVIRGIGTSCCQFLARMASIIAPFLIPQHEDAILVCYIIMGTLMFLSVLAIIPLPETNGTVLEDKIRPEKNCAPEDLKMENEDEKLDKKSDDNCIL